MRHLVRIASPAAVYRLRSFLGSGWFFFYRAIASSWDGGGGDLPVSTTSAAAGQKRIVENRWREFFADPSQWWDHRSQKAHTRYPDFKHKATQQALWLNGRLNPPWVEAELAAMAPGTVQLSIFQWNAMLGRYATAGQFEKTMEVFHQMQQEGMIPDGFTFVPVLNACSSSQALEEGKLVHEQIIQSGCESDVFVSNSLINMYAKCGSIEDAKRVFNRMATRNVASWNAMILGHVKCGQAQNALELSRKMQQEGVQLNAVTFVGILNACASIAALEEGRHVHEQIVQNGFESNVFVSNSLIDMYAKCGAIEDAQRVFNKMPTHDAVSWTAMILGHVKCGQAHKALQLSHQMQREGVKPDHVTYVGLLNACANVLGLEEGKRVHEQIIQSGCKSDVFVSSSLIDMYAKCGSMEDALKVFSKMPTRDVVSWNALLGGYAMHGHAKEAVGQFEQMSQEIIEIDEVTFVALLSACSHGGFVDEGLWYFESMGSVYGVSATVEHYACMVDLLGRAGHLQEAEDLIKMMTGKQDSAVWKALLGACRIHGNLEMTQRIAKQVVKLDT
ncbi:unnamed protein product [Sphagnum compactum]